MARALPVEVRVNVADLDQFKELVAAVRKVVNGDTAGRHPTHLGGCIGQLSEPWCECGMTDLRYAVFHLEEVHASADQGESS